MIPIVVFDNHELFRDIDRISKCQTINDGYYSFTSIDKFMPRVYHRKYSSR